MKVLVISALLLCLTAVMAFGADLAAENSADPNGMEIVEKDDVAGETVATEEDKEHDTAGASPAKELENDESGENEVANDEDTNNAESVVAASAEKDPVPYRIDEYRRRRNNSRRRSLRRRIFLVNRRRFGRRRSILRRRAPSRRRVPSSSMFRRRRTFRQLRFFCRRRRFRRCD